MKPLSAAVSARSAASPSPRRRAVCIALALTAVPLAWPRRVLAAASLNEAQRASLREHGLVLDLTRLADFENARVMANPHLAVRVAVRHRSAALEIRYGWMAVSTETPKMLLLSLASQLYETAAMNITDPSGGGMVRPEPFPAAAVKAEFNADAGWTSITSPRPTFARSGAALINGIFSERHATLAWSVYLFDPRPEGGMESDVSAAFGDAFHALRFAV